MLVVPLPRKPPSGDEAAVITIEFLRARLLAERASSKAAREHVKQLNKKVGYNKKCALRGRVKACSVIDRPCYLCSRSYLGALLSLLRPVV